LARLLETDTACREVGNASVFEFDSGIRDVRLLRQHGNADSTNFANRRGYQAENDVDVMNHEIENDVDVEASRSKCGKPMDLEKLRLRGGLTGCSNDGIEPLHMADLKGALVSAGRIDQRTGLFERRGHRLLDENIDAMLKEVHADSGMIDCRYSEADRV